MSLVFSRPQIINREAFGPSHHSGCLLFSHPNPSPLSLFLRACLHSCNLHVDQGHMWACLCTTLPARKTSQLATKHYSKQVVFPDHLQFNKLWQYFLKFSLLFVTLSFPPDPCGCPGISPAPLILDPTSKFLKLNILPDCPQLNQLDSQFLHLSSHAPGSIILLLARKKYAPCSCYPSHLLSGLSTCRMRPRRKAGQVCLSCRSWGARGDVAVGWLGRGQG